MQLVIVFQVVSGVNHLLRWALARRRRPCRGYSSETAHSLMHISKIREYSRRSITSGTWVSPTSAWMYRRVIFGFFDAPNGH